MGYGVVARVFHWLTVLIVLIMIPVGLIMTQDIPRNIQDPLFILHKALGPILLVVVLLQLGWRASHPPPPLPADIPPLQRRAAAAVHAGLYLFLIVQAVSGYVRVTTGGFPLELLEALGILLAGCECWRSAPARCPGACARCRSSVAWRIATGPARVRSGSV